MNTLRHAEKVILETQKQPFGLSVYLPDEKVSDFVGRVQEITEFKQYIQMVNQTGMSQAIRLEGPAGVGKSTLFNYIKEEIEEERINTDKPLQFLEKDVDVISSYFRMPESVSGFRSIWKKFMYELSFDDETGVSDIRFTEYVALKLIYRLLREDPEVVSKIIWENQAIPDLRYIEFHDVAIRIDLSPKTIIPQLQNYFKNNRKGLRRKLITQFQEKKFEIKRKDTSTIINLFRSLNEEDEEEYYDLLGSADLSLFTTDDEVIEYFNDLWKFYMCATGKGLIILLGIDEIVKYDYTVGPDFYKQLGYMFVKWRDKLKSILFVFISTSDDWSKYDEVLIKNTDLRQQILPILHTIPLTQLSIEESSLVFDNRMNRFWESYASTRPSILPFYPFTHELFAYVLRTNFRNLRESIIHLNDLWTDFKVKSQVPKLNSSLRSLRYVKLHRQKAIFSVEFRNYDWEIVRQHFMESIHNKSNTARSGAIERGLEQAWKTIQQEKGSMITRVRNNPTIKINNHNRRPDVVVEILGQFSEEDKRRIEFQVKAYKAGNAISYSHVQSSLELFNAGYTDLLYFLMSGELDTQAQNVFNELSATYPQRIRRPILREEQVDYQYFLACYEDIVGWSLGDNPEIDIANAKDVLERIIEQPIDDFFEKVRHLTYRVIDSSIIDTSEPGDSLGPFFPVEDTQTGSSEEHVKPIEENQESTTISGELFDEPFIQESEEISSPKIIEKSDKTWIVEYRYLEGYENECIALVRFLMGRENRKNLKNKYTLSNFKKKVIDKDSLLTDGRFKQFNKLIVSRDIVQKIKSSFVLTDKGMQWYNLVKSFC